MSSDALHSDEFTIIAPKPAYARAVMDRDPAAPEDPSLTDSLRSLLYRQGGSIARRLTTDRRATPRVQAEIICVERLAGTRYLRTTYDVSTFGLSTQYGHLHPVGTELDLELQIPDDNSGPLLVRARVVGHMPRMGGMRMAFKNPSRETVRRLHRFLFVRMEAQGTA